jgi:hypothetical protein
MISVRVKGHQKKRNSKAGDRLSITGVFRITYLHVSFKSETGEVNKFQNACCPPIVEARL